MLTIIDTLWDVLWRYAAPVTVLLVTLRLAGEIALPWWVVLAPLWLTAAAIITIVGAFVLLVSHWIGGGIRTRRASSSGEAR